MKEMDLLSSQPWVERLGWALVHFLWQGVLISASYAAARRVMARSSGPNARYALACIALALMMAAPIVTLSLTGSAEPVRAAGLFLVAHNPSAASIVTAALPEAVRATITAAPPAQFPVWAVMLWLTGAIACWVRLMGGWIVALRMRSRLVRPAPPEWQRILDVLATRIQLFRPVRLLNSALVQVPTVVGWLRPVVLVPVGALAGLPPGHMEALLLHELAHIRRHDYLVNLLQSAAEALLFYHPAVWWISAHIRAERELCCDDIAVSASGDALTYARALAEMEWYRPAHAAAAVAANGGSLPDRIGRLLGRPRPESRAFSGPAAIAIAVLLVVTACAMFGQSSASPHFDVASIKPDPQGGADVLGWGFMHSLPGGRLVAEKALLRFIIQNAYGLKPFQLLGGPDWINSAHYDIEARSEANPDATQMRLMAQALLEDRFKLKVHRETRELPVYALTIAKGGLRLPQLKEKVCIAPDSSDAFTHRPPAPGQSYCGRVVMGIKMTSATMSGEGVPMAELARMLSNVLGRIVIDKTGFDGSLDVNVEFTADDTLAGLPQLPRVVDPGSPAPPTDPGGPTIFSALQEQLGLKLQSTKGPVEVVIIDDVDRPSEN